MIDIRLSLALFICLMYVLVPSSAQLVSSTDEPLSGPVITSVTGCIDMDRSTINCPRSATITLHGSGFLVGITNPVKSIKIYLNNERESISCSLLSEPLNNTLTCTIALKYGELMTTQPLNITIRVPALVATCVGGMSLAYTAPPRIDRISGCSSSSDNGQTAMGCDVINSRITLQGSGFSSIANERLQLNLGSQVYALPLFDDVLLSLNETVIILTFAQDYGYIVPSEVFQGLPLPFYVSSDSSYQILPSWSTNSVAIQFAPLPPPVITAALEYEWTQGCDLETRNGSIRYRDCIVGRSELAVEGEFFWAGSRVFVGGQPVVKVSMDLPGTMLRILVPVYQFDEGTFYDLTVTNGAGSTTMRSVIEFNTLPTITDYTPCALKLSPAANTAYCLENDTLSISVVNVQGKQGDPRVLINNGAFGSTDCFNARFVDPRTIHCTVPKYQGNGFQQALRLVWPDGQPTIEAGLRLWDSPYAPRIHALTGPSCYQSLADPSQPIQCLMHAPSILTIIGAQLDSNWTVNFNSSILCSSPTVVDKHTITCMLPAVPLNSSQVYDMSYPLEITGKYGTTTLKSNVILVQHVHQIRYDDDATSSSSLSLTIALAVVLPVIAVSLVGYFVLRCLRHTDIRSTKLFTRASDDNMHIELAEEHNSNTV